MAKKEQHVRRLDDDGPISYIDGTLCVNRLPIGKVVAGVGTPVYVYSADAVANAYRRIAEAFAPLDASIHYAVKANSSLAVLRLLAELGSGFDVVSGEELLRVLRAGGSPSSTVFAGVGKTRAELSLAVQRGVTLHVESADELDALQATAARAELRANFALRLRPAVDVDTHSHIRTGHDEAKFGIPAPVATELLARVAKGEYPNLDAVGVHVHVGSQLPDPSGMVAGAEAGLAVIEAGREHGLELDRLDVGGGLPVDYTGAHVTGPETFARALAPVLEGKGVRLQLEPGRAITARAGVLVGSVLYRKHEEGRRMVVVDTGMHQLLRPALYGSSHRIVALEEGEPAGPTEVVGPVCESSDTFGIAEDLPELSPGDMVAILDAGAYGMTMASNYNGHPRPPEILVEGGVARVTRRRETWDDLMAYEHETSSFGTVLPSRAIRQRMRIDDTAEFKVVDLDLATAGAEDLPGSTDR